MSAPADLLPLGHHDHSSMTLQLRVADKQGQSALLAEGRGAGADMRVMADIVNATPGLGWRTCRREPAPLP